MHSDLCSLFVNDDLPEDKRTLEMFLASCLPGVVIPISFNGTRLSAGPENVDIKGNRKIQDYIRDYESRVPNDLHRSIHSKCTILNIEIKR